MYHGGSVFPGEKTCCRLLSGPISSWFSLSNTPSATGVPLQPPPPPPLDGGSNPPANDIFHQPCNNSWKWIPNKDGEKFCHFVMATSGKHLWYQIWPLQSATPPSPFQQLELPKRWHTVRHISHCSTVGWDVRCACQPFWPVQFWLFSHLFAPFINKHADMLFLWPRG